MAFPEAKLKALEEKISHSRWVVPVLPEQELEALLIATTELATKGLHLSTFKSIVIMLFIQQLQSYFLSQDKI
jgi:hypothetical protein